VADIPKVLPAPIDWARYAKNGDSPQGELYARVAQSLSHTLRWRRKEVFRSPTYFPWINSDAAGAARTRWRFRCHTGFNARRLAFYFVLAPQTAGFGATSPYAFATVTPSGGADLTQMQFHGGAVAAAFSLDQYSNVTTGVKYVDISDDTTYEVRIGDVDYGRLVGCVVFEESTEPTWIDYPSTTYPALAPIYDSHREKLMPLATDMWKRNAAHLFNWTVDDQASPGTATSSQVDPITGSTAAVSTSTPGYVLDLTYRNTRSTTTVPCVFAAYGVTSSTTRDGEVYLKNSAGTTLATVTIPFGAAAWFTTTVNLPTAVDTYHLRFSRAVAGVGSATISLYAVSLYQYA